MAVTNQIQSTAGERGEMIQRAGCRVVTLPKAALLFSP